MDSILVLAKIYDSASLIKYNSEFFKNVHPAEQ
jgi:hypothetical protein